MGRGSAVLVRFDNTVDAVGVFQMREAIRSAQADPNCDRLPLSSCQLSTWAPAAADNMLIGQFTSAGRAELEGIKAEVTGAPPLNASNKTQMDVCFTPMGRTFVRYDQVGAFAPLTGVPRVRVYRTDLGTGNAWGIARLVLVMPNGNARLGTAEVAP